MPEKTCERCLNPFPVPAYRMATARFCSMECKRSGHLQTCPTCGAKFYRSAGAMQRVTTAYCSKQCAAPTLIKAGDEPWNKNKKGIHLSPSSEFKPGRISEAKEEIGAVRIRTTKKDGSRAWVKVADPNVWMLRAAFVWIAQHGPIPNGMLVHHIDRDKLNDDPKNLKLLTKAEHLNEHRHEFKKRRRVRE